MNTYQNEISYNFSTYPVQTYNLWSSNTSATNSIPYPYYFTNNYNFNYNMSCNQQYSADLSLDYSQNSPKFNDFSTPITNRTTFQQSLDNYSPNYYQINERPKFLSTYYNNSLNSTAESTVSSSFNSVDISHDTHKRTKRSLDKVDESFLVQEAKKNRSTYTMECSICFKEFESKASLIMHKHIYHNKGNSKQCPLCGKKLHSYSSTIFHLKIHTKEKDYNCEYCRASFTDATALKRHIRTHTGERPYKCRQCNKAFSQSGSLKRHMKIHTQEKYTSNQNEILCNQSNFDFSNDVLYQLLNDF